MLGCIFLLLSQLFNNILQNSELQHPFPLPATSYFLHRTQEKGVTLQKAKPLKNGKKHASVWLCQKEAACKGNLPYRTLDSTVSALISS